jgi:putative thioredoxin
MAIDVTDATFETEVVARSDQVAVVVDLWAPWCGPCKALGPILDKVIDATGGKVILAKVNVDENPGVSQAFRVQSIPAVYALKGGRVVSGFTGAKGEGEVAAFVAALMPTEEESVVASLLAAGDEASLRQVLELEPGNADAVVMLAELLVGRGLADEALALLARIPETPESRRVAALARTGQAAGADMEQELLSLLDQVKDDDAARQRYIDLLEIMGPDHPNTAAYRKKLTARLF